MLEGVKQIASFVAGVTGRSFSESAVSRASDPGRPDPLPVQYDHGGRVYADEVKVRAWALRPGQRQRRQPLSPPPAATRNSSSRRRG